MNLSIYFYMGGWWGDTGSLSQMLSLLSISYGEYQDPYVLRAYPLPCNEIRVNRWGNHLKHAWLWRQKFG